MWQKYVTQQADLETQPTLEYRLHSAKYLFFF